MDFIDYSPSTYSAKATPDFCCLRLSYDFILRSCFDKFSFDIETSVFLTPVRKTVSDFPLSDNFLTFYGTFYSLTTGFWLVVLVGF